MHPKNPVILLIRVQIRLGIALDAGGIALGLQVQYLGHFKLLRGDVGDGAQANDRREIAHPTMHLGQDQGGDVVVAGQVDQDRGVLPFLAGQFGLVDQLHHFWGILHGWVDVGGDVDDGDGVVGVEPPLDVGEVGGGEGVGEV